MPCRAERATGRAFRMRSEQMRDLRRHQPPERLGLVEVFPVSVTKCVTSHSTRDAVMRGKGTLKRECQGLHSVSGLTDCYAIPVPWIWVRKGCGIIRSRFATCIGLFRQALVLR